MIMGEKMSNWSKEDLSHFNGSEVMQEFEKNIIENLQRASILNDKIAQQKPITQDITEGTKKLDEFNRKLDTTVQKLKNLADDGEDLSDDESIEDVDEMTIKAKKEIINELLKMAKKAISEGEYRVAYDIERTIDELNEVEITCD